MKLQGNTVGIDLAKQTFHLVGTDTSGKIVWRKRLTRTLNLDLREGSCDETSFGSVAFPFLHSALAVHRKNGQKPICEAATAWK